MGTAAIAEVYFEVLIKPSIASRANGVLLLSPFWVWRMITKTVQFTLKGELPFSFHFP